jgi:hypothetical protein
MAGAFDDFREREAQLSKPLDRVARRRHATRLVSPVTR